MTGVVAIVIIWWLASVLLFQASHAIPGPPQVIGYFFSASAWSDTLTNLSGTLVAAGLGYLRAISPRWCWRPWCC